MKKLISLLLATLLILSLAGCGASGGSESPASTAAASGGGSSSAFPSNTITIYCGYSAGGGSDVICRIMAEQLSRKLGVNVIVEDVTGSGGWVLWTQILENTAADGYSISLVNTPNYNLGAYDLANPRKYHYDDLDLLCNWVSDYNAIAIRADETRYTDWDSFVEYWQSNPLISSASAVGVMSDDATLVDRLVNYYGTEVDMVQSNGASDNKTMLLNGSTDFFVGNVSEMAKGHLDGEFKIICVFAPERDQYITDVPTFYELTGEMMIGDSSRGFALPKGVDPEIREIIMDALRECINDPETMARMAEIYTPVNYVEGEEYYALMQDRVEAGLAAYDRLDELNN